MTKKIDLVKESNDAEITSNMYNLVNLTILTEMKKSTKITRLLDDSYKDAKSNTWLTKITITIINSVLTQNRKVFILNRDFLTKLVDSDSNHYGKVSFNNSKYKQLIDHITKYLCKIEKIKRNNYYVMMCIITHAELLKIIKADITEQENEVRTFINNKSTEKSKDLPKSDQSDNTSASKFKRIVK